MKDPRTIAEQLEERFNIGVDMARQLAPRLQSCSERLKTGSVGEAGDPVFDLVGTLLNSIKARGRPSFQNMILLCCCMFEMLELLEERRLEVRRLQAENDEQARQIDTLSETAEMTPFERTVANERKI